MDDLNSAAGPQPRMIAERDILALVAMLDYLVMEIAKFDMMSAHSLLLARKSLLEAVADALVRTH